MVLIRNEEIQDSLHLGHYLERKNVLMKDISRYECGVSSQIKQVVSFVSNRISKENCLCGPKRKIYAMTKKGGSIT